MCLYRVFGLGGASEFISGALLMAFHAISGSAGEWHHYAAYVAAEAIILLSILFLVMNYALRNITDEIGTSYVASAEFLRPRRKVGLWLLRDVWKDHSVTVVFATLLITLIATVVNANVLFAISDDPTKKVFSGPFKAFWTLFGMGVIWKVLMHFRTPPPPGRGGKSNFPPTSYFDVRVSGHVREGSGNLFRTLVTRLSVGIGVCGECFGSILAAFRTWFDMVRRCATVMRVCRELCDGSSVVLRGWWVRLALLMLVLWCVADGSLGFHVGAGFGYVVGLAVLWVCVGWVTAVRVMLVAAAYAAFGPSPERIMILLNALARWWVSVVSSRDVYRGLWHARDVSNLAALLYTDVWMCMDETVMAACSPIARDVLAIWHAKVALACAVVSSPVVSCVVVLTAMWMVYTGRGRVLWRIITTVWCVRVGVPALGVMWSRGVVMGLLEPVFATYADVLSAWIQLRVGLEVQRNFATVTAVWELLQSHGPLVVVGGLASIVTMAGTLWVSGGLTFKGAVIKGAAMVAQRVALPLLSAASAAAGGGAVAQALQAAVEAGGGEKIAAQGWQHAALQPEAFAKKGWERVSAEAERLLRGDSSSVCVEEPRVAAMSEAVKSGQQRKLPLVRGPKPAVLCRAPHRDAVSEDDVCVVSGDVCGDDVCVAVPHVVPPLPQPASPPVPLIVQPFARWRPVVFDSIIPTRPRLDRPLLVPFKNLLRSGVLVSAGPAFASAALGVAMTSAASSVRQFGWLAGGEVGWVEKEVKKMGKMRGRVPAADDGDGVVARAREMVSMGDVSGAKGLLAEGAAPAEMSAAQVAAAVAELFPTPEKKEMARVVGIGELRANAHRSRLREVIVAGGGGWEEVVSDALWKAQEDAAPGLSGLRVSWLRAAVTMDGGRKGKVVGNGVTARGGGGAGQSVLGTLAAWVDGVLAGGAPELLGCMRLRLIPKPKGGARPIAVGEALGALAKRVVNTALLREVRPYLEDGGQWGACVGDGDRRLAGLAAAAWDAGWHLTTLDVKNAFNSVHRRAVAHAVLVCAPLFEPFVSHCLRPVTVVGEGVRIQVSRGVMQGDPMSTTLFSLVMLIVTRMVVARCAAKGVKVGLFSESAEKATLSALQRGDAEEDVLLGWYADDGTLAWKDAAKMEVVVKVIGEVMSEVGMALSLEKCEVVAGCGASMEEVKAVAEGMGMKAATAVKVLGVPVGEVVAAREMLVGKVKEQITLLKSVWKLGSPFAEVAILRQSGLVACLRWVFEAVAAGVVNGEVMEVVEKAEEELVRHIFGDLEGGVTEAVMGQATAPLRGGGLGLLTMRRAGVLGADGKWRVRSEEELKVFDEVVAARVKTELRGDAVRLKRYAELTSAAGRAPLA